MAPRSPRGFLAGAMTALALVVSPLPALAADGFTAIPLGVSGGLDEGDLTAFLLAPDGSSAYISLDAGTLLHGLQVARTRGSLAGIQFPADSGLSPEGWMLQKGIKAYLISHPHLDHLAGMILASPDDGPKTILGTGPTIDVIRDSLFNWKVWPAFGDEGQGILLKKYHYTRLEPGTEVPIAGTSMAVEPFLLSHAVPYQSTAFLVRSDRSYALYFGDTGPDAVEGCDRLRTVWRRVAPLVKAKALRAVFIEVSFPDGHPDKLLYGHLTPAWLMAELCLLAQLVDPQHPHEALRGLKVVVTHIKPSLKAGRSPREVITAQLKYRNDLGVTFIVPEQGERLQL